MARSASTAQAVPALEARRRPARVLPYDGWLLAGALLLMAFGLVMVASASVTIADRNLGVPLHYFWRQLSAALLGLLLGWVAMKVPLAVWYRASALLLLASVLLLGLVLVPGLGHEVNGSMRWLRLGPVSLQASEPAKLCFLVYLAAYLVRHGEEIRSAFSGFIKPVGLLLVIAALLLLEPDYGATVVLFATALGMLFLGGVPAGRFLAWGLTAVAALVTTAVIAPYRLTRLMTFMDPWADPYDQGFQLTQALIAFGRGEWLGVGLGQSIQKLFYLPEVHTDFIFAVVAEELGLAGTVGVLMMFAFLLWRAFEAARIAEQAELRFQAYLAYGIGLSLGLQALTNMGVNMGVLPTKGLTLPFVSYGSNSLVTSCIAVGLLLRVGYEARARRGEALAGVGRHD